MPPVLQEMVKQYFVDNFEDYKAMMDKNLEKKADTLTTATQEEYKTIAATLADTYKTLKSSDLCAEVMYDSIKSKYVDSGDNGLDPEESRELSDLLSTDAQDVDEVLDVYESDDD